MLLTRILLFFFLTYWTGAQGLAAPMRITDLRCSIEPTKIRLVFDATGPINYTCSADLNKITLTIRKAKLIGLLNKTWLYKTPITKIMSTQHEENLQIVLQLKVPLNPQHFVLTDPYRLVLDFPLTSAGAQKIAGVAEHKTVTTLRPAALPAAAVAMPVTEIVGKHMDEFVASGSREVVIVIDPGHGGKDPGAIGVRGTYEKEIALAVAKALQSAINKVKGFRALLTRKGDYFIPLRERLEIAHRYKADMFIAIHADAYKYGSSRGASIFALSQRGATSEAARWLAEKENESELGQAISDKNALLRSVLLDLAQTATISASLEMGEVMLRELLRITNLHSPRIEQAGFVVLKSPDIPSLLVETGFISDPYEEKRLRNNRYQRKIAGCLAAGITRYFILRPPQGTYLAKIKNNHKPYANNSNGSKKLVTR